MVETLITIYILICVAMIVFDCFFLVIMNVRHRARKPRLSKNKKMIVKQLANLLNGKAVERVHDKKLAHLLKNPVRLHCFSEALDVVEKEIREGIFTVPSPHEKEGLLISRHEGERCFEQYVTHLGTIAETLFEKYRKKDPTIYTYYVFFLNKHDLLKYICKPPVMASLKDLLEDGDIHVCENVLQAIYSVGDPTLTVQALMIVDKKDTPVHPKIISDGLLGYRGDAFALQSLLLNKRERFSVQMQVNILNYIRFASDAHCERIFAILLDEKTDDEVRFSCIRYFGKYKYDPAYFLLRDYVCGAGGLRHEYCLISLTALRNYPGKETVDLLKMNLRSPNWYIRYNAAESLSALGIDYADFVDIFDGEDRFSRDILQFQFDRRYAKEKEEIYL